MDKYEKLKEIKDLFDKGLLNENEYSKFKNEVLFKERTEHNLINHNIQENTKNQQIHLDNEIRTEPKLFSAATLIIICCLLFGFFFFVKNKDNSDVPTQTPPDTTKESNSSSSINNSVENNSTICKICGRKFTGDGYDKIDGVWEQNTSIQTELCSPNCAMIEGQKQEQKYNTILEKHGYAPIENTQSSTNSQVCSNCMGHYVNGFCDMCGAASPERVSQSLSNRPNCEGCNGMGYVSGYNGRHLCSACRGTGKLTY